MTTQSSSTWYDRFKQVFANPDFPQDRDSLFSMLHAAQENGLIPADSMMMVEGAIQVADQQVRDIMIPRAQMVTLSIDAPPEELISTIVSSGHSRFPVVSENKDNIVGIFLAKDLLDYYARDDDRHFNMRDVMRPAIFVPESKRLNVLLREFRTSRNHIAIVVDEYGGTAGLVTIEDVLEQIVGKIDDEHDIADDQTFIKPRDNGFYSVHAMTPIDVFNEYFNAQFSDEEFDTIAGLVMQGFGHLPQRGEKLTLDNFYFEVLRANSRRIHLLRVIPPTNLIGARH